MKCRGHFLTLLRRQTILFYVPRQECWEGENDALLIIVKYTCVHTHTHTHAALESYFTLSVFGILLALIGKQKLDELFFFFFTYYIKNSF